MEVLSAGGTSPISFMRKILLLLFLFPLSSYAQKDTSFWFAAPEVVEFLSGNPHDKPLLFRLTSFGTAANVSISIPANPSFTPVTASLAANSSATIDLSAWDALIENAAANTIANKGILIRSNTDITAYYEVKSTCNCNPELFALKGKSAIGNEFIIGSQKEWPIDTVRFPTARSAFNIVATENNTLVTVTPSQPLIGRPAGVPFSITLQRGQTFSNQGLYRNGPSLLNGSIVTADKPVSVTASEDLLMSDGPCADLAGDQLIPTSIWGDEFVVIRGALTNKDKAVVTALANGTALYIDGNTTPVATINRGQSYEFNFTNPTLYIKTSNRVSVYHYTGINCEIGSAVIPKINCTGSQDVAITRSIDEDATVFIVTRQGNQAGFTVNGNAAVISAADFSPVPGTAGAFVFCKKNMNTLMTTGISTRFINATGKFSLGFLNGATPVSYSGCRYGYFSDFKSSNVTSSQREICRRDSAQLSAFGGTSYQWSPAAGLSSTTIANPKASPAVTTDYKVIITTVEGCIDSAFVKVVINNCEAVPVACNNWLNTPSQPSYASIGDLDITGNQVTIEANFVASLNDGGNGDLVSKHSTFTDVNYLLRAYSAEITTTNGYFQAASTCPVTPGKIYHAALVYDGSTLKLYRNGFVIAQVNATGNLVQNNWKTWIGFFESQHLNENFHGYINEVRIWNVARTQADIRANMAQSLAAPATQPGLQAYYTFDNLINKQGNAAWNAVLGGGATINRTIPDCNFIADSCNITPVATVPCNNWLSITAADSYARVGDLDIPGSNVTVEAVFNRTAPYTGGYQYAGDLVSKHNFCDNVNYLLRPNSAEITTTNGYFIAAAPCEIELNKTYHVAMTYDGAALKFYRNGFLISQVPATGTLIQNNLNTQFGRVDFAPSSTTFIGYMNEVRIWNVTRSEADIRNYMNSTLPSPSTQTGLQGYYTFDNLVNKQGNTAFNGSLISSASINNTNPVCTISSDSCGVVPSDSLIINTYTPVLSLDICKNNIVVEDASTFNTGDTVLVIQMKGAAIDSTNTATFGTVNDYKNAGNYEFNYVKSKTGNTIELLNTMVRQYDIPVGKVQLVRVPYYHNVSFTKPLTCLPWDGSKGGVLVFNARDTVNLNHNIDVSGRGFRGGIDPVGATSGNNYNCYESQYFYPPNPLLASGKGEGIAIISDAKSFGRGPLANGGGGGNSHNSGGGGGGNGATGGLGGYSFEGAPCNATVPFDNRGLGGKILSYSNVSQKIFLGGGGGAGQSNNPDGFQAKGGNGAGIVIITAARLKANGHKIAANGHSSATCGSSAMAVCGNSQNQCHEGMGGGGAAGSVLTNIGGFIDNTLIETIGGKGGDMTSSGNLRLGPGGGGAGGLTWFSQAVIPANVAVNRTGGANGVCIGYANTPWGSTPGAAGVSIFSLNMPVSSTPFKANIDSVRFTSAPTNCSAFNFNGLGYTNTHPVATWQWFFGDGGTANTQNTSHTYTTTGTFIVKLVITDINGCKDSITRPLNTNTLNVEAGNPASYCSNGTVTHQLSGSGGGTVFNWQPAALLDDNTIANPTATLTSTTKFYLTKTDPLLGCSAIDSVIITVNPVPLVTSFPDTAFCANASLQLNAAGAASYTWSPAGSVSNPNIANPVYTGTSNQTMTVTGTNAQGCSAASSFDVTIKALPTVTTIPDSTICNTQSIVLTTTGAASYSWSPPVNLSNPNIASPVFSGTNGNTYTVTGTAANGCSNTDVVIITTKAPGVFNAPPNASVCINSSVMLNGNNGTAVTYTWSPAATLNNTTSINPLATPTGVGNTVYTVLITEPVCNSSNSFNVNVTVNPLPDVDVNKSNDLDCSTRTSTLTATGAAQYQWTPAATLSSATGATTIASPASDIKYIVTGTDANGCKNKDSVMVLVKGTNGRFDIPNSFTPNGDGKNDCFGVKHWGDATGFRFMIFNRWGEKVFETNNINQCWDGRYKGQPADIGGYVYYIKSVNLCGEMIKKGNVILIR